MYRAKNALFIINGLSFLVLRNGSDNVPFCQGIFSTFSSSESCIMQLFGELEETMTVVLWEEFFHKR